MRGGKIKSISQRFGDEMAVAMGKVTIKSLEDHGSKLEDWEKTHIEAFKAQLEQSRPLSVNKQKILRGIYQRSMQAAKHAMEKTKP